MRAIIILAAILIFGSCRHTSTVDDFVRSAKSETTPQKAIEDYNSAIKLNPKNDTLYYLLGVRVMSFDVDPLIDSARQILRKRNMEAWNDFTKAIALKPNFAEAYNMRAIVEEQMDSLGSALDDFTTAIKLKPNFADAYFNRGYYLNLL